MIYACDACRFVFERVGECTECPDCGKKTIREADDKEKEDYIRYQEENKRNPLR